MESARAAWLGTFVSELVGFAKSRARGSTPTTGFDGGEQTKVWPLVTSTQASATAPNHAQEAQKEVSSYSG